ncbi:MAG TPA: diguanylate cyclase [Bryobacteraceae bacterium]|nr:diguanylate cyclase [Bryobacteraceae bacterium]
MNLSKLLKPPKKPLATRYPTDWEVRRVSIDDDLKYRVEEPPVDDRNIRLWALVYGVIGVLACIVILAQTDIDRPGRFLIYLACANVAAFGLRLTSSQSVLPAGFLFLLLGIGDLSLPELLFIALSITLQREARALRNTQDIHRALYAVASVTIGLAAAQPTYKTILQLTDNAIFPAPIIASAFVLMINCGLSVMLLTKPKEPIIDTYRTECRPLLPWFIATAYFAYLVQCAGIRTGYHPAFIALPLLFTLDRGYRTWTASLAERKEEFAQLHRNTLETLALAIDARDQTTHMHLRRVQISALAVGRELKLSEPELEALNISAMLHDIGKLGIPDHILLKPGSLTAQEWEKMKTHALIGADMLARMHFPELVSDIVKAHHEKWDGSGYPLGIRETDIPIGARILSAVDCLDALASDRPYRAALPLDEAMDMVRRQSGKSYDPAIVAILEQKYLELDRLARATVGETPLPSKAAAPTSPAEGIANLATRLRAESKAKSNSDILEPIVSARQETQLLQALAADLAQSTHLDEVASVIYKHVGQKINFDTLGLYVRRGEYLEPIFFLGAHLSLFNKKVFPITEGLSGWVAQHVRPVLNGNVSIECCYANDSLVLNNLQSALAVPFEGKGGMAGVITLYHLDRDAFSQEDLRILESSSLQIGPAIEGALRFQDAKESAATDHLTGVPNARALALHLTQELQRASRDQSRVGVLVCDLDGFKQVNDRFGHLKGNEVLQCVAKGLRETCREYDYVARMGGDEFVIVVPDFPADYSPQLERLRAAAVRAGEIVSEEPCLSMSVGVAIFPADGRDAEALLANADKRMYQLKRQSKSEAAQARATDDNRVSGPKNDLQKLALAGTKE